MRLPRFVRTCSCPARAIATTGGLLWLALLAAPAASLAQSLTSATYGEAAFGAMGQDYGAKAQDGLRLHQGQIRARQARLRDKRGKPMAQVENRLTLSDEQSTVELRLKDQPRKGRKELAHSSIGRSNVFVSGNMYNASDAASPSGLSTNDLTLGTDYRYSEDLTLGLAAGRLSTRDAVGNTLSAYVTVRPIERLIFDMSLSVGSHQSHFGRTAVTPFGEPAFEGSSRGFSLALNHPRQFGPWTWSPYSRYERIVTDVEIAAGAPIVLPVSRDLSAVAIGSTVETLWASPLGTVRPSVLLEMQREVTAFGGTHTVSPVSQTQGIVGLGMSTRVTRDMSAFAESRFAQAAGNETDRRVKVGVKLAF